VNQQGLWLRPYDQEGRLVSTVRKLHCERQRLNDANRNLRDTMQAQADELSRLRGE
jgi:hypothetical protein